MGGGFFWDGSRGVGMGMFWGEFSGRGVGLLVLGLVARRASRGWVPIGLGFGRGVCY